MKDLALSILRFLGSDFVSLAMYRGLSDDFRLVAGQLRPFSPSLFFFLKCQKRMSSHISGHAGQADQVKVCLSPTATRYSENWLVSLSMWFIHAVSYFMFFVILLAIEGDMRKHSNNKKTFLDGIFRHFL